MMMVMPRVAPAAARPVAQGAWPRAPAASARPVLGRLRVPGVGAKRVVTSRGGPRGVAGRGGRRAVHAMAEKQSAQPPSKVREPNLSSLLVPPLRHMQHPREDPSRGRTLRSARAAKEHATRTQWHRPRVAIRLHRAEFVLSSRGGGLGWCNVLGRVWSQPRSG